MTEVLLFSWIFRLDDIKKHVNPLSDYAVKNWWNFCLKIITAVVLGSMAITNFASELKIGVNSILSRINALEVLTANGIIITIDQAAPGYEAYGSRELFLYGWIAAMGVFVFSFIFQKMKGHKVHLERGSMSGEAIIMMVFGLLVTGAGPVSACILPLKNRKTNNIIQ